MDINNPKSKNNFINHTLKVVVDPKALCEHTFLTLSVHTREGYSSHFVCQSVSHFLDFEDGFIFKFETRINVNKATI